MKRIINSERKAEQDNKVLFCCCLYMDAPKLMPFIYFHEYYNKYKKYNNTVG